LHDCSAKRTAFGMLSAG